MRLSRSCEPRASYGLVVAMPWKYSSPSHSLIIYFQATCSKFSLLLLIKSGGISWIIPSMYSAYQRYSRLRQPHPLNVTDSCILSFVMSESLFVPNWVLSIVMSTTARSAVLKIFQLYPEISEGSSSSLDAGNCGAWSTKDMVVLEFLVLALALGSSSYPFFVLC